MKCEIGRYFAYDGGVYRIENFYKTRNNVTLCNAVGADGEEFGFHPSFPEHSLFVSESSEEGFIQEQNQIFLRKLFS